MSIASQPMTGSRVDPKVLHPLDRLRGTIRKYVVVEGLLSAAIFVSAWFALGILFDFGLFKLATWDWVLDAPAWLRGVALAIAAVLLAGLVVLRIAARLTRELSYPALALVLERKFPKILGDRLITAVELADIDQQQKYGYSSALIRQTIDEAREKVATVPVNEVFNWKRLRNMAALAVGMLAAIVIAGFIAFAIGNKSADPVRFGWKFAHVTTTFLERNVLIENVPWPRRAHIELVDFPASGDLRIGKDAGEPTVRAKAYRWVIADHNAPMGWRPLVAGDLGKLLGSEPALPEKAFQTAAEGELGDDAKSWELDRIQAVGMEDKEARERLLKALTGPEYEAVQKQLDDLFSKLDAKAGDPSMGRTLRKLDVPEQVMLGYGGVTKTGEVTLGPQKNQEFASPISDLKESVYFTVRAEDFRTPSKQITLVPPPVFTSLSRTEFQPAYLHHTPPDLNYSLLKDKRQKMADKPLSLTGDRSVFSVASGTELTLVAKLDTDLTRAYLLPKVGVLPGAIPGSAAPLPVAIGADGRTVQFELAGDYRLAAGRTFKHVYKDASGKEASQSVTSQATLEFDLVVEQADKVQAKRQIMIQIADDQPPVVELAPDVIRKIGAVYYVTPKARIPFNPESYVRDDHGLSKVAYEFTYWSEDTDVGRAVRAQIAMRPLMYAAGPANAPSAVAAMYHASKFKDLDKGDQRQKGSAELRRFIDERSKLQFETVDTLKMKLNEPLNDGSVPMVTKLELKSAEVDYFDLKPLKLLANVSEVQTRYRLDLNITATDANYDTGPKTGTGSEPIRLLIVSEGDLLAEINKEEEAFATRLDEGLGKINVAKSRLAVAKAFFPQPERIEDARVKMQDASQEVAKVHDIVSTLVREYRRIYRECQINDVTDVTRDRFGKFANRMDRVCGENPPLVAMGEDATPPAIAFPEVERRLATINDNLNANRWGDAATFTSAELGLLELERILRAIRAELGELQTKERLKAQLQKVIDDQERIGKDLAELERIFVGEQFKKDPKIGTIGPVFLTKGEAKKLKHTINWRQFAEDDLPVKFSATDNKDKKPAAADALVFAPEMKLNFEKHQTDFEYEIKAGAKEGEYTLVIVPSVGEPVMVLVTVK
jgi:hypothetical protein